MEAINSKLLGSDVPDDEKKIYRLFGIPDYKWKLIERVYKPKKTKQTNVVSRRQAGGGDDSPKDVVDGPVVPIQKVQRGSGAQVITDVSEIGMNIAEQLFRLEKSQGERHPTPQDSFGWQVGELTQGFKVMVSSPEKDAYWVIPEELIMNVTTWVQQTYLTQPGF